MFGEVAQSIRKKIGATQEELGTRWEKSRVQIGRYEKAGEVVPEMVADAYHGIESQLGKKGYEMKTAFFPGVHRMPSMVDYWIIMSESVASPEATIVMTQDLRAGKYYGTNLYNEDDGRYYGTSLYVEDEGRDILLNRILANDLAGIRVEFIKLVVIVAPVGSEPQGLKFDIKLDVNDYCAKGNPHEINLVKGLKDFITRNDSGRTVSMHSHHVVAGCARFFTEFESRQRLSKADVQKIISTANI